MHVLFDYIIISRTIRGMHIYMYIYIFYIYIACVCVWIVRCVSFAQDGRATAVDGFDGSPGSPGSELLTLNRMLSCYHDHVQVHVLISHVRPCASCSSMLHASCSCVCSGSQCRSV